MQPHRDTEMYALISLLVVASLSLLVIRVGTVALVMTGLSEEVASFQSLSAFSGAGFTTDEAERALAYPARRKVVKTLIRLGSVGLITAISSLVLSFTNVTGGELERVGLLVVGSILLASVARSQRFNKAMTPIIERALRRATELDFELRDYTNLLRLHRDYRVADVKVTEGDWLADTDLEELDLPGEGVVVLGIRRSDGTYIGAPGPDHRIQPGDTLIAYGQRDRLQELAERSADEDRVHEEAKDAHERMLAIERELDPEQGADRVTT